MGVVKSPPRPNQKPGGETCEISRSVRPKGNARTCARNTNNMKITTFFKKSSAQTNRVNLQEKEVLYKIQKGKSIRAPEDASSIKGERQEVDGVFTESIHNDNILPERAEESTGCQ